MPDEVPPAVAAAPRLPVDVSATEDPAPKELMQARCDETAAPVEVAKPPVRVQPPANGDVDVSAERNGVAPADEAKNRLNTAIGRLKRMRTSPCWTISSCTQAKCRGTLAKPIGTGVIQSYEEGELLSLARLPSLGADWLRFERPYGRHQVHRRPYQIGLTA